MRWTALVLLVGAGLLAEEPATAERRIACSAGKGKESRTLIHRPAGKGCEVVYERDGASDVVASARNDPTYCDRVVRGILKNLKKAGFKCR